MATTLLPIQHQLPKSSSAKSSTVRRGFFRGIPAKIEAKSVDQLHIVSAGMK
jgi:hypothetical protein